MKNKLVEIILISVLNVKIEIRENTDEECFDYDISNITEVNDKYLDFFISYSFYAKTKEQAILRSLRDLHDEYENFLDLD